MTKIELEEAVAELPTEEQVDLLARLWDNLAADPRNLGPLTSEDRAILDERLTEHEADPSSTLSIDDTVAEARRIFRGQ
jgi:putative addiction module component (TIGR02574 family)